MQGIPDIVVFINALKGEDNNMREQAEKRLDMIIESQPWMLVEQLIQAINENRGGPEVIQYSFVVLKHIFSEVATSAASNKKKGIEKFRKLTAGVDLNKYGQVMVNYLYMISKQPETPLRMNVIRATSSFAEIILTRVQWPSLVEAIVSMINTQDVECQTVGALMAEEISSLNTTPLKNIADSLVELLKTIYSRPMGSYKASVLAIINRVYTNLIIGVSVKTMAYKELCEMTDIFWKFLDCAIAEGDTVSCNEIINSATLLLQCRTKLCNDKLLRGFGKMAEIVTGGQNIPIKLKKNAMSLFTMYTSNFAKLLFYSNSSGSPQSSPSLPGAGMISTNSASNFAYTENVVNVLIMWCSDIPDNENWITTDPESEDEEDETLIYKPDGTKYLYRAGQDMLDILAVSLGYNIMYRILSKVTDRMLISPEWRVRSTACIMYCICAEGLSKVPESLEKVKEANATLTIQDIREICQKVCALTADPHPRVRWAVAQTLGQMCVDLSPRIQQACGKMVIDTLHTLMNDSHPLDNNLSIGNCHYSNMAAYFNRPCLRVVAHATSSLGNFYTESKISESTQGIQNFVVSSIDESLRRIQGLMASNNIIIQKNCITTLGSIANMSSTYFSNMCGNFLNPCLDQLERYLSGQIVEPPSKRPFANQLIETISLIGHAVGPEKFREYGIRFMNMLIRYNIIGEKCTQNDSMLRSALFKAMSNVNNSMGRYLQQEHINAMMQTIVGTLQSSNKSMISLIDGGDGNGYDDSDSDDPDVYDVGGMKFRYNTAILEEIEDASDLLELLMGDHFIECCPFYETILTLSINIIQSESQTMMEFAMSNILCVVIAIKHLLKCIDHPEKNETGLQISVSKENIYGLQNSIFTNIMPSIIKAVQGDFLEELSISKICIDIIRNFIFSAPQIILGSGNQIGFMENYFVVPIMTSYESMKSYMESIIYNEEGEYDDVFILEEKDNYVSYAEVIGLAIASGFSFMRRHPEFNFIPIFEHFGGIISEFLKKPDRSSEIYVDLRSASCIVGQNISKLPSNILSSNQNLKVTLSNVIFSALDLLSDSLTIKGSGAATILPSSEYPLLQAGFYLLKCVLSAKENISIVTEIFEMVARYAGMSDAWAVLDYIVNNCAKFASICLGDDNNIDEEIQITYDNAVSLWFSASLFAPTRYVSLLVNCLSCMQKMCEDPVEIADIIKTIYRLFTSPSDAERQIVSNYQGQLLKSLVSIISNNVVRYSLRPSIVNLAKMILQQARNSDPNSFNELVKSLNNQLIEADISQFLSS